MVKKGKRPSTVLDHRTGGVYISDRARVNVDGDLVGRDKITSALATDEFNGLFTRLLEAVEQSQDLNPQEKKETQSKSEELKEELKQSEPDLGKLDRLKKFISSKGGAIAAATGAIFQYPPVQELVKSIAQRLVGG
jgi:hypothetical protein